MRQTPDGPIVRCEHLEAERGGGKTARGKLLRMHFCAICMRMFCPACAAKHEHPTL